MKSNIIPQVALIAFLIATVSLSTLSCSKEKTPTSVVDPTCTTTISFSADILPIMQAKCINCHSASNPSGGYNLSNYAGVAQNPAKVLGSVKQDGSASVMPQGADKLADSLIQKISCWISQGAANN